LLSVRRDLLELLLLPSSLSLISPIYVMGYHTTVSQKKKISCPSFAYSLWERSKSALSNAEATKVRKHGQELAEARGSGAEETTLIKGA